jgi:hypothetical protein
MPQPDAWNMSGAATGRFVPMMLQRPWRGDAKGKATARFGTVGLCDSGVSRTLIDRFESAIKTALFEDDDGGICAIPGYFNNPYNPFQKDGTPEPEGGTRLGRRSPERYGLALEAVLTFMSQAKFKSDVAMEFAHFMHCFDFQLRGFEQDMFKRRAPRQQIDSPFVWTIKCWLAIAVEAYLIDGAKDRTNGTRFIADCLTPHRGKRHVEKALAGTKRRTVKSFAGAIEDWNRAGRAQLIPLPDVQGIFDRKQEILKFALENRAVDGSNMRLGDAYVIVALDLMETFLFISRDERIEIIKLFRDKAKTRWPLYANG